MTPATSEPEIVTRARTQLAYYGDPAGIATRLLTAYDELAGSVREREAAAWDAGFASGIAYQAGNSDVWRNPYREGKD